MPKNRQVKQNRRGAPDGNANNLRLGFYSRQYKGIIQNDLDGHKFTGLTDEITALRVFLCETIELSVIPPTPGMPSIVSVRFPPGSMPSPASSVPSGSPGVPKGGEPPP